jgi:FkbM family methyltransferase
MLRRVAGGLKRAVDRRLFHSFALGYLDVKLRPFLDFERGFFVEAGAYDGVTQSNTLYFERYRRWGGLLVEPVPELAALCRRNRPDCLVEEAALVPADHPGGEVEIHACHLMSVVKGGMRTTAEEEAHVRLGAEVQDITPRLVRAPGRPLSAILDQHGITRVDLLSLDVEGFELPALRGLDFTRHRPRFILVEARYRDEIDAHLAAAGYHPIALLSFHDVLYTGR